MKTKQNIYQSLCVSHILFMDLANPIKRFADEIILGGVVLIPTFQRLIIIIIIIETGAHLAVFLLAFSISIGVGS